MKHRTGKFLTGQEFVGFKDLKVNSLIYFNDEIEKQALNGVCILWKVTSISENFQMMKLKGFVQDGSDLREVDVMTYDMPPELAPPSKDEPPSEAA